MENKQILWVTDPAHSEILFKVKHMVITTLSGRFQKFEGKIWSATEDFTDSKAEFTADIDSITTGNPDRDAHLKSPDFFDAANYPVLKFVSTEWKKKSSDEFLMTGDLTIRGITRKIELEVNFSGVIVDPYGNKKAGYEMNSKISRKEFGLLWNQVTETGGIVVSDEVKLQLNVEVIKQQN